MPSSIYSIRPNLVLGFHGCDEETGLRLIGNTGNIVKSRNTYDWLGHGFYLWENNYDRAWEWACNHREHPFVVGAVLSLGLCLDFTDSRFTQRLSDIYPKYAEDMASQGKVLPRNFDARTDANKDKLVRNLDCSVIEYLLNYDGMPYYDSVRGAFEEGGPAFPGAAIKKKTHIQISVRNDDCIKGFFLPRKPAGNR